jgi:hypothetical protein
MRPRQSITIIVLLVTAGAISTTSTVTVVHLASHGRQAPCHEHGRKAPGHEPLNYACCLTGHNAAVVPSHFSIPYPTFTTANVIQDALVAVYPADRIPVKIESFGDPPGTPPLRI